MARVTEDRDRGLLILHLPDGRTRETTNWYVLERWLDEIDFAIAVAAQVDLRRQGRVPDSPLDK